MALGNLCGLRSVDLVVETNLREPTALAWAVKRLGLTQELDA